MSMESRVSVSINVDAAPFQRAFLASWNLFRKMQRVQTERALRLHPRRARRKFAR